MICLSVESEQLTRLVGSHKTTEQELDRQINEFDNKETRPSIRVNIKTKLFRFEFFF